MKKIAVLFILICINIFGAEKRIIKENEYIDISSDKVKLLFMTEPESKIEIRYGEKREKLNLSIKDDRYKNNGIIIERLMHGKTYFYQIISQKGKNIEKSPILSFAKSEINNSRKKPLWAENSVFYEIFVRSFYDGGNDKIGDFYGISQKTDYLSSLGINAVWLMPIFKSPSYHGYDVSDFYEVNNSYGTIQDFENMVKNLHEKGVRVIIDFAVNHTSNENMWFKMAADGKLPYRDYYIWNNKYDKKEELSVLGTNPWVTTPKGSYYALFGSGMPDLNFRNKMVREEIKKAAKFWIDKGIDGFRLDASKHIDNDSDVTNAWLQEFTAYCKSIKNDFFIADGNWGQDTSKTAQFITEMNRIMSELKKGQNKAKLAASLLFTLPGTPFIYSGEEIGQTGTTDENIRGPIDWYQYMDGPGMTEGVGQTYNQTNDGVSVEEEEEERGSLLEHYKMLIKIRNDNKAFFTGEYDKIETPDGIYGYNVFGDGKNYMVLHNYDGNNNRFRYLKDTGGKNLIGRNERYEMGDFISLKGYETAIIKY